MKKNRFETLKNDINVLKRAIEELEKNGAKEEVVMALKRAITEIRRGLGADIRAKRERRETVIALFEELAFCEKYITDIDDLRKYYLVKKRYEP